MDHYPALFGGVMLKTIEKIWPWISILLFIAILASLFLWPGATRTLSLVVIGAGLVAVLAFTIRRPVEAYRQGRLPLAAMRRNLVVDVLGVLLSMAAVILVAGKVAGTLAQAAGRAWGLAAGVLAAVLSGLAIGYLVSFAVRWLWGLLTRPKRAQ
jgi:hypothetical protein